MSLDHLSGTELPATADFHVHLRDGAMMKLITPTIRQGGVDVVYVMPNLVPPLTTSSQTLAYRNRLTALEPNVTFLTTLYLHPSITPATVAEAAAAGISGIKSYPAGVTTNSASGVHSYEPFYPVFEAMQNHGLVLNLHGELPSKEGDDTTVLNAEERFLPTLRDLHMRFPRLKIVLEHLSTAAAVSMVKELAADPAALGMVAGTITAHHLGLTVDSWAGQPHCFCKPVAKTPLDRDALLRAVVESRGEVFFGSDSAPHPVEAKRGGDAVAAGVFTGAYATQMVLNALEVGVKRGVIKQEEVTTSQLSGFLGVWGREFYGVEKSRATIVIEKKGEKIAEILRNKDDTVKVVPYRSGKETWSIRWAG